MGLVRMIERTTSNPALKMQYRPELDGIRALAIICVIMFHYDFHDWWGGFTGVDIFFVLSGFLICGQTYLNLEKGSYSVLDFFARRIRRLSTAFFVCFFAIGLVAYWLFLPAELHRIFANLLSSSVFVNNFTLLFTQGYFNLEAEQNPFLHTWSLSIEEQFYIVLPILIVLTARSARIFSRALVVVFVVSLALMLLSGNLIYNADQRFFSSIFRVWELALGALVFLVLHKRQALFEIPFLPVIGLIIALAPTFVLGENTYYPGLVTLLPTFGTALLIASCSSEKSYVGKFLASRVMSYIGRISYGTYLWHWPIIAFYRYAGFDMSDKAKAAMILASFLLGAASHHFIESPMRRISIQQGRGLLYRIFAAQMVMLIGLSVFLFFQANGPTGGGATQAIGKIVREAGVYHDKWGDCWTQTSPETYCQLGTKGQGAIDFVVWGDSMANSAFWAFDKLAKEQGKRGYLVTSPSCVPLFDMVRDFPKAEECLQTNQALREYLKQVAPMDVYVFARWSYYAEGYADHQSNTPNQVGFIDGQLQPLTGEARVLFSAGLNQTLDEITQKHRLVVINQVPVFPYSVPKAMLQHLRFGADINPKTTASFERRSGATVAAVNVAAQAVGADVLEPHKEFCTGNLCQYEIDGSPLLSDHTHLSITGNDRLFDLLLQ